MFTKADLVFLAVLFLGALIPLRVEQGTFVKIEQPLTVRMHKNFPPYLAHLEATKKPTVDADQIRTEKTFQLSTDDFAMNSQLLSAKDIQHFVLDEVRVQKTELAKFEARRPQIAEEVVAEQQSEDTAWIQSLPRMQRLRLELAQQKSDILEPETKAAFSTTGAFRKNEEPTENPTNHFANQNKQSDSNLEPDFSNGRQVALNVPVDRQTMPDRAMGAMKNSRASQGYKIKGKIEMTGGLAVTHEHSIDIRHLEEGVYLERGQVNLIDGTYSIHITDPSGVVLAKLVNSEGKVLGEAQFRVTNLDFENLKNETIGPKLTLTPRRSLYGSYFSQYSSGARRAIPNADVSFFQGNEDVKLDSDKRIHDSRLALGSQTVVTVDATDFHASQKIVTSGDEFEMPLLPTKMVSSLRQIVSDSRQQDLTNPDGTLIWGQAKVDGKPLSGITVEIESAQDVEPIYFNELFLPDPSLKTTSSNGYYAFLEVQPGFHSLIAHRGDKYFAHDNVVVEKATVTLSEMKSTINSKPVQIKSYDAFSGAPQDLQVELQTVEAPVSTLRGVAAVFTPDVHRLSLIKVPNLGKYSAGIYQYDDFSDYIHIPLVTEEWIASVRQYLKLDDVPNQGTVIGFVNDEDFEIYTAQDDDKTIKVYFDAQGKILSTNHGVLGGGFIIFNLPPGTNEAVVYGLKSEKFYSQVIPVDPSSLNVLSFHSEY